MKPFLFLLGLTGLVAFNDLDHGIRNHGESSVKKPLITHPPRVAGTISQDQAATLIYYYKKHRIDQYLKSPDKEDTRYIDFEIDEMINYLQNARNNLAADSMRLYFGVYSPTIQHPYRNSLMAMFIPTKNSIDIVSQANTSVLVLDETQLCPPPYPGCHNTGAILMNRADSLNFQPQPDQVFDDRLFQIFPPRQ